MVEEGGVGVWHRFCRGIQWSGGRARQTPRPRTVTRTALCLPVAKPHAEGSPTCTAARSTSVRPRQWTCTQTNQQQLCSLQNVEECWVLWESHRDPWPEAEGEDGRHDIAVRTGEPALDRLGEPSGEV